MNKSREIKNARGEYILLERPEYNPSVLIKGGRVVNEEGYKLFKQREAQNKFVPTQTDREFAQAQAEKSKELETLKSKELENKVDKLADNVDKLTSLMEKVLNEKA